MPESPVAPITTGIVFDGVPLREGEEGSAATLNLEHQRRKDSEIEELRTQLARLGLSQPTQKFSGSLSARKRQRLFAEKVKELKSATKRYGEAWEGPCAPATVINFNPVRISLQGELQDQFVPAAGASLKKVTIPYKGRTFVGSYVTLTSPKVWSVIIGTENIEGLDSPAIKVDYISPVGIAYQLYSHYIGGGSRDADDMGGIVIFEGDIHVLEAKRQERAGAKIRVPVVDELLSDRDKVAYVIEERFLDECLEDALTRQRRYASAIIEEGHRFATSSSEELRNQKSSYHVLWHNYALKMGYKEKAEPWASEVLQDSPGTQAIFCPGCRNKQMDPQQHFCERCNAPFDAFKSFMAGQPVPLQYLESYEGEKWDAIRTEAQRRAAKRALLEAPEPKKGKKSED